ncbi:MAG: CehA/McbA family metallohydrolase [Promethearchaeota archaeon]
MKKFDLHIHSTCSRHKLWGVDGLNSPQQIVETAINIGLDGIALTDHNTIKGGQKAIRYVKEKKLPLLIIPGAEIRSNTGDILALGINEEIPSKLSVLETIDVIKEQGGIAIAAHPYKYNSRLGKLLRNSPIHSQFAAIEVFNSNIKKDANDKASHLADELSMPGVAGSDAHYIMNIGNGITCLDIDNLSLDDFLNAIKTNKIKLICKYPPKRNTFNIYFKKFIHMLRRIIGKGNKSCID